MQKIILASNNKGKIAEIQEALGDTIHLVPQDDFNIEEADENMPTFVENALLKARHAAKQSNLPAIADDSGLVVDVLNGAPGIFSARYGGPEKNPETNIQKLIENLMPFKSLEQRKAYFYCALVYVKNAEDPVPLICQGKWEGNILFAPQGQFGFGYDPVFWVPTHQCSAAELSMEEKNRISHRAQALGELKRRLTE